MNLELSAWQLELNQRKTVLCGVIGTVYQENEDDFWLLCGQAGLSLKKGDIAGNTFPQRLNNLFDRLIARVAVVEVRTFLAALIEDIKIDDFVQRVIAIISLIDQHVYRFPTHKRISVIKIEIAAGTGPDRSYESKISLAESVIADAKSKLAGQKTGPSEELKCPGRKGTACALPSLSVDFISHVASWEHNVTDTMKMVADLRAIEERARTIITDPSAGTVGIEREKLRHLLILVDRFLLENDFPLEWSGDLGTEAEGALANLLSRAEFVDSTVILEALFRSLDFIKKFENAGEFGLRADNQHEFECQYTDFIAYLAALQQSLSKYAEKVLRREHEGFSEALAGIADVSSILKTDPHRGSSNKLSTSTIRISELRSSASSPSSEHVDQLKGE